MTEPARFHVSAIYGAATKLGLVDIRLVGGEAQVLPSKAREMATNLLEAASAAEGDEILIAVLERAKYSDRMIQQVLMAVRRGRLVMERLAREEARRQLIEDAIDDDAPDAQALADGYALLVGELRAALAWYADERNYDAGPVASINRYDRWPVVQDAGERARAILAADPEARADDAPDLP